jgi:dihydropteroate synthase
VPVIEALAARIAVPISVDTSKPEVIRAATRAGARLVNDVRGLRLPGALEAVSESGAAICLMHMQGEPGHMQLAPRYDDVVAEVGGFLAARLAACRAAGIARERVCVDPGIGFGKSLGHNLALLRHLGQIAEPGIPVLVGISRKSLVGMITGRPTGERLAGSIAFATLAVAGGATIVSAHDVASTVDAVKVAHAWRQAAH